MLIQCATSGAHYQQILFIKLSEYSHSACILDGWAVFSSTTAVAW